MAQSDTNQQAPKYIFSDREKYWQEFWEKEQIYHFDPESQKPLYSIDTPPPTISGSLHLGHIFSYTQAEVIARYRRFAGYNVRYPFGLDNNGLPTERLVEKEKGIRGQNTSLKEFIQICLEVTDQYKVAYENLWKSLGLSVDWRLEYSTISPQVQVLAQRVFKELYDKGLIYRSSAPALYCFECQTSVAQAEVEDAELDSVFYDLRFTLEDGQDVVIATTRPELLPACVAVFVHPDDERFKHLVGKKITTPLGDTVPVLSDEKVDKEKGSGVVMCCSYGDDKDVYWVKTYKLPEKMILEKSGKFKALSNAPYMEGKSIKEGRQTIVEELKSKNAILNEKAITHTVGVHERCGTPIEYFTTIQWFVKVLDVKPQLLELGKKVNWYPKHMHHRFIEWTEGLKWDWSISRERFYGIPIPVYYCKECDKVYVPEIKEHPVDPRMDFETTQHACECGPTKLIPETTIFDTWFTSSLTPDINNNFPLNGSTKGKMYPMSMRPQAHDIIRTWAFYTTLMGFYRHNEIPWNDLMISGHILAKKGVKISKKTGGGKYKPEELISTHSADAIRYVMCGAKLGADAYYDENEVEKGKKLVNKLYNAGKFVLSHLSQTTVPQTAPELTATDKWILARATDTAIKMAKEFEKYELIQTRQTFEDFFWADFCDNYLEIVKGRLFSDTSSQGYSSAIYTLHTVFQSILIMASPFVPHITEELFHAEFVKEGSYVQSESTTGHFYRASGIKSLHSAQWPKGQKSEDTDAIEKGAELLLKAISEMRKSKTQNNIRLGEQIETLLIQTPEENEKGLTPFLEDLKNVAKAGSCLFVKNETPSDVATEGAKKLTIKID